jgi:hypothetical protein
VALAEGGFVDQPTPAATDPAGRAPVSSAGAALVQLGKAARTGPALDAQAPLAQDEDPGWAHDLVAATAEGMGAATFLARPDEQRCQRCPVRRACPAQPEGADLA